MMNSPLMKMFKKSVTWLMLLPVLFLVGCDEFPFVTPEQHSQVVEYTTSVLLRHAYGYDYGLVKLEEIPDVDVDIPSVPPPPDDDGNVDDIPDDPYPPFVPLGADDADMTEIVGIPGLVFDYAGFMVVDEYPENVISDDVFFITFASMGAELLVVKFTVTNESDTDIFLDMVARDFRIGIGYNGANTTGALMTMLPNDLALFQGRIPNRSDSGELLELVVICEVRLEDGDDINSVELIIRTGDDMFRLDF
ncbi:MAG: hypothetical protein LBC96_02760 [Lachnospiraceae bacterium]|jgi:hypothetical protein|nr:hypothetical protein [Lachnospiraceae bacterium]